MITVDIGASAVEILIRWAVNAAERGLFLRVQIDDNNDCIVGKRAADLAGAAIEVDLHPLAEPKPLSGAGHHSGDECIEGAEQGLVEFDP